ncbi:MAG: hypothetical protein ABIC95_02960 [archaeon]
MRYLKQQWNIIRSSLSAGWGRYAKIIGIDILFFVFLSFLLNAVSSWMESIFGGLLSLNAQGVLEQAAMDDPSVITGPLISFIGLAVVSLIVILLVYTLSRAVVWSIVSRSAFSWKTVFRFIGFTAIVDAVFLTVTIPMALAVGAGSGVQTPYRFIFPILFIVCIHALMGFFYYGSSLGRFWKTIGLTFRETFGKVHRFLGLYSTTLLLLIVGQVIITLLFLGCTSLWQSDRCMWVINVLNPVFSLITLAWIRICYGETMVAYGLGAASTGKKAAKKKSAVKKTKTKKK